MELSKQSRPHIAGHHLPTPRRQRHHAGNGFSRRLLRLPLPRTDRWAKVLEIARDLINVAPDIPNGPVLLACALHKLGRTQEAYETLKPACDAFPNESGPPYNLARFCCALGRIEEVRQWLAKALEIAKCKPAFSLVEVALVVQFHCRDFAGIERERNPIQLPDCVRRYLSYLSPSGSPNASSRQLEPVQWFVLFAGL